MQGCHRNSLRPAFGSVSWPARRPISQRLRSSWPRSSTPWCRTRN